MDPERIKVNFICPLCQVVASPDPVLCEDGFIYHDKCFTTQRKEDETYILSPMTGAQIGSTLVNSQSIASTIDKFLDQSNYTGENKNQAEQLAEITIKAELQDPRAMATLGRWHLFGEQQGVVENIKYGFELVKKAHEKHNIEASAYYGHCLVRGLGVEKNKSEGFELLVDAACEGTGQGKDFAAYTLGFCYKTGYFGFKQDEKKAAKWLNKVVNKPEDKLIWGPYDFRDGDDAKVNNFINDEQDQGIVKENTNVSKVPIFDDAYSMATITTTSSTQETSNDSNTPVNFLNLTSQTSATCEACKQVFEAKDLMHKTCRKCFDEDLNNKGLGHFIGNLGEL